MKRLSALLAAFLLLVLAAPCSAYASAPAHLDDTILVKLPNQATMTLFVKNKQQLRELRNYKLDSLMILLDKYITQAEAAGKSSKSEQVTMEFYPAKDQPGKQVPEQIRITVRNEDNSPRKSGDKVEVSMGRLFGVKVEENAAEDGSDRVSVHLGSSAKDDSVAAAKRQARADRSGRSDFSIDLGLNALVNKQNLAGEPNLDLRTMASRYVSLNWHYIQRIGSRRSPLYIMTGPELSFNNYMLDNNYRFLAADNGTYVVKDTELSLEKSKLATTVLNLPLVPVLNFRDDRNKSAFRIGAGGFVGYRLASHTKIKYEQDGSTRKDKDRSSYNLEDFQYGLQGLIGLRSVTLFAKYNLNEVFKDNRGPQANVLSFGISLSDFD
ncbi:outer membrane beta-barrel protein [Hymenobacter psychrotolerans]|uniref:Outer membrane protein beta-barrel domain-containing protein n=1 Tax=Hymenobacter psychrotolerans DSM 18569 TaxID=1121959 RepID=A0A1M7GH09_9BACT|nr:outer membrane beta-barrel protein [Hymenobacter psychrotolerans]SHM15573.1 Outer membrane protein beta-barrel domain-containing protein [Hymenobacter psychrotolerans DSM 18569]